MGVAEGVVLPAAPWEVADGVAAEVGVGDWAALAAASSLAEGGRMRFPSSSVWVSSYLRPFIWPIMSVADWFLLCQRGEVPSVVMVMVGWRC